MWSQIDTVPSPPADANVLCLHEGQSPPCTDRHVQCTPGGMPASSPAIPIHCLRVALEHVLLPLPLRARVEILHCNPPLHQRTRIPCTQTHASAPRAHTHNQPDTPLPSGMHPSGCGVVETRGAALPWVQPAVTLLWQFRSMAMSTASLLTYSQLMGFGLLSSGMCHASRILRDVGLWLIDVLNM